MTATESSGTFCRSSSSSISSTAGTCTLAYSLVSDAVSVTTSTRTALPVCRGRCCCAPAALPSCAPGTCTGSSAVVGTPAAPSVIRALRLMSGKSLKMTGKISVKMGFPPRHSLLWNSTDCVSLAVLCFKRWFLPRFFCFFLLVFFFSFLFLSAGCLSSSAVRPLFLLLPLLFFSLFSVLLSSFAMSDLSSSSKKPRKASCLLSSSHCPFPLHNRSIA